MTSPGVRKPKPNENVPVLVGSLVLPAPSVVCGYKSGLNSLFVSSCCLVVGICSVVAESPSLVSSFTLVNVRRTRRNQIHR